MAEHLVEWDTLDVRIRGDKLEALARHFIAEKRIPVERLELRFLEGSAVVQGSFRKGILSVPFRAVVGRVDVDGKTIVVTLREIAVLGLAVPAILRRLGESAIAIGGVDFDSARNRIVISLESFLPEFVEASVRRVELVPGAIAVTLAEGGADPPSNGESSGRDERGEDDRAGRER
jgi:hypothetical protein